MIMRFNLGANYFQQSIGSEKVNNRNVHIVQSQNIITTNLSRRMMKMHKVLYSSNLSLVFMSMLWAKTYWNNLDGK